MGIGIGVVLLVVIGSVLVAWKGGSYKLGQAVYFMFIGLLLSSVAPGMAQAAHDFLTNTTTSVQNIDVSK